ncbi:hypothetical protein Sjap_012338 [Stephania japonica]|uniref:Enhancer of polycomb-like protein n=1 Tax=Stephania japonica TaxID=461633 RepID=A0AAP0IVU7_9MAGN
MPSVGMRRSTRIFVPKSVVKDADMARVLRSGKRLGATEAEADKGKEDWIGILGNSGDDVAYCKNYEWKKLVPERDDIDDDTVLGFITGSKGLKGLKNRAASNKGLKDRVASKIDVAGEKAKDKGQWVIRYSRKRWRSRWRSLGSSGDVIDFNPRSKEDRMCGKKYFRKRRKVVVGSSLKKGVTALSRSRFVCKALVNVVVEQSCSSTSGFARFLVSVLNSIRSSLAVDLSMLAGFLCSQPIVEVFSRHGIHFLPDLSHKNSLNSILHCGTCLIFGSWQYIPSLSLEFSVAPLLFMRLHFGIWVRSLYLSRVLEEYLIGVGKQLHEGTACANSPPAITYDEDNSGGSPSASGNSLKGSALATGFVNSPVNTRNFQKKRSAIRSRRARHPSCMGLQGAVLVSNANSLFKFKVSDDEELSADWSKSSNGLGSLSTPTPNTKRRRIAQNSFCEKDLKSTLVELKQNVDSLSCDANILVTKSDRCYRIEGAKVGLECLGSEEWCLAVKVQDSTRYKYKALDLMKPSTTNRVTHAMIWTGENGWKLEVSDRRDWVIFKELYKECADRNSRAPSSTLPVPGVRDVESYEDFEFLPFVRPESYISMPDDVQIALTRKTANYDLDSGDEEWLEKLNKDISDGKLGACVSAEKLEEMVDEFEKAAYTCPDVVSDENKALSIFPEPNGSDIIAAVYQYWSTKRKQRRAPLLRAFQDLPTRKPPLAQDSVNRKKRSLKQQSSQSARTNQRISTPAVTVETEQETLKKIQEAKDSLKLSVEVAVQKRKRAQALMSNADLAAYWATMAVRIAESAELAELPDAPSSLILD